MFECGEMTILQTTRTSTNIRKKFWDVLTTRSFVLHHLVFKFSIHNNTQLMHLVLLYGKHSGSGENKIAFDKDLIIVKQRRKINNFQSSLKST